MGCAYHAGSVFPRFSDLPSRVWHCFWCISACFGSTSHKGHCISTSLGDYGQPRLEVGHDRRNVAGEVVENSLFAGAPGGDVVN
jgi:hypothetical protein